MISERKISCLTQVGLNQHVQLLSDYLSQPWFCRSMYSKLWDATEKLVEGMRKYEVYLRESFERVSNSQQSTQLPRSPADNVLMRTISGSADPIKREYSDLLSAFEELPDYQPLFLNEYAPERPL